jgi:hypothetical protein
MVPEEREEQECDCPKGDGVCELLQRVCEARRLVESCKHHERQEKEDRRDPQDPLHTLIHRGASRASSGSRSPKPPLAKSGSQPGTTYDFPFSSSWERITTPPWTLVEGTHIPTNKQYSISCDRFETEARDEELCDCTFRSADDADRLLLGNAGLMAPVSARKIDSRTVEAVYMRLQAPGG